MSEYKDIDDFFAPDEAPEPPPEEEPARKVYRRETVIPDLTLETGLPADVRAEMVLLGAILLDNAALKEVSIAIEADDFSLDSHRRICLRMSELFAAGKPIDIVTLSAELSKHKEVEAVGGVAYLASLTEGLPRRPVINEYIRIVKDKSLLRNIMMVSSCAIASAADQGETALEVFGRLETQLQEIKETGLRFLRKTTNTPFFLGYRTFVETAPENIDWTVEEIVQKEGNGLILGDSGTSKSLLVFDLTLHLVAGVSWFHHKIPQRVKVGLVSREDAPGLSQNRLKRLVAGASDAVSMFLDGIDLEEWVYVNTRAQRETWTLQNEADIQEIVESIKERGIQICFFDVFRVLWHGNENDSQETAAVLAAATRIGREANCQVCIIHHLSKSERGTIFDRARGGGINGWKEWGMGLTVENPDAKPQDQIRKIQFHTKAGCACAPICYRIDGYEKMLKLVQVEEPAQEYTFAHKKKAAKKEQDPQVQMPYAEH